MRLTTGVQIHDRGKVGVQRRCGWMIVRRFSLAVSLRGRRLHRRVHRRMGVEDRAQRYDGLLGVLLSTKRERVVGCERIQRRPARFGGRERHASRRREGRQKQRMIEVGRRPRKTVHRASVVVTKVGERPLQRRGVSQSSGDRIHHLS